MNTNLEPLEESDLDLKEKFGGIKDKLSPDKKEDELKKSDKSVLEAGREIAGEVSSAEKDSSYGKILSKVKKSAAKPTGSDDEIRADAEMASKKTDAESQIQHLVDLALNKGVIHAVKVAKHLEDNYVLDMFHDKLLADEFHKALVEKGLIGNS